MSPFAPGPCRWCQGPIPPNARSDARFCSKRCRQASWRFRIERAAAVATDRPMRFAYDDPPYQGTAHYYPERQEVDHTRLLEQLTTEFPDGWALSTSSQALRDILPLCPPTVRVAAWFKQPRSTRSRHALSAWEPVIVAGGRPLPTDVPQALRDTLTAAGRFRAYPGAMIGMKPPAFAEWMFRLLGAAPGDELVDLFPGSGAITRAWERYTSPAPGEDAYQAAARDAPRPPADRRRLS